MTPDQTGAARSDLEGASMTDAGHENGQLKTAQLLAGYAGIVVFVAVWFSGPELAEGASASAARRFYEDNLDAIAQREQ